MSIILTCGQNSGYMRAHKSLTAAGLVEAMPSRQEQYSPVDLSHAICKAYKVDQGDPAAVSQIEPGKVWQALSGDLMLANLDQTDWGWADPNTVYLLDYWRDYDPLFKFVLTYSSPEYAIAELLTKETPSSKSIERVLSIWQAVNSELLRFYSANKDRTILVNSSAISEDTGRFIDLTRARLDVELTDPPRENSDAKDTAIPELLASLLIEGALEAQSLCQELESAADMPGYVNQAQEDLAYKAWDQYRNQKVQFEEISANSEKIKIACDEHKQRAGQHKDEIARLCQQRDEQKQEVSGFQNQIDQLSVERDKQGQKNEYLLLQFLQAREELGQVSLKYQEKEKSQQLLEQQIGTDTCLRQQIEADNRQLMDQVEKLEAAAGKQAVESAALTKSSAQEQLRFATSSGQLTDQIKKLETVLNKQATDITESSNKIDEQGKENKFLFLQLHKVQEELEQVLLNSQEKEKSQQLLEQQIGTDASLRQQFEADNRQLKDQVEKLEAAAGKQATKSAALTKLSAQERQQFETDNRQLKDQVRKLEAAIRKQTTESSDLTKRSARQRQQFETDNKRLKDQVKKLESVVNRQTTDNAELAKLNAKVDEQGKENELLLLQLHQVQEELEHYFLKHQETSQPDKQMNGKESTVIKEKKPVAAKTTDVVIDMRQIIDGDNWYYAEHDGRWAGPGKNSSIHLPVLDKGRYRLELDFVDSMAPDIIKSMKVSLDGKPLRMAGGKGQIGPRASIVGLYRKKLKYPLLLTGQIQIGAEETDKDHILEFSFPKTVSPAIHGADDKRELAVRLRQVKLSRT